jgi:hypothetical protein
VPPPQPPLPLIPEPPLEPLPTPEVAALEGLPAELEPLADAFPEVPPELLPEFAVARLEALPPPEPAPPPLMGALPVPQLPVAEVLPRPLACCVAATPRASVTLAERLVAVLPSPRASTCQARASVDVRAVALATAGPDVGMGVVLRALLPWSLVARTAVGWVADCGGPEAALRAVPSALAG